jgi:hypothetical protein
MRAKSTIILLTALSVLRCSGAGPDTANVWKQPVADAGLRQAFERTIYRLKDSGHGYAGMNPAQRLAVEFTRDEARLSHPRGDAGFRLQGLGYGAKIRKPEPADPTSNGNRVEYRRGGLTEWYVNQAGGLEQGFTLAARPGVAGAGESLVIEMAVSGSLHPASSAAGGITLADSIGQNVLRYGGLQSWDARGRAVPSHMEVRDRGIRLVVEDQGAEYPLVVDPAFTQEAELTGSDQQGGDEFSSSLAIDGNTAIIGAFFHFDSAPGQGAAYIFVRNGTTWTQQQELNPSDGIEFANFGTSVALSGNTAVVGEPGYGVSPNFNQGAANVFVRSGTTWTLQQQLLALDGAGGDFFGNSVSVNGDTVLVGAPEKASSQGAAYVFVRSGTTWTQQQELTASVDGAPSDSFGASVSVSGDTAFVGAPDHTVLTNADQGAAYVFVRNGSAWAQLQELTSSDGTAFDFFGISVSVQGSTAVVGASGAESTGTGAAYVFVPTAETIWAQQQILLAADGSPEDGFGVSVAVNGNLIVVGAPNHTDGGNFNQGAAYVFQRNGVNWPLLQELIASDGASFDLFGTAVSVSGDTVLVGAPGITDPNAGYVFRLPAGTEAFQLAYAANLNIGDSFVNITNGGTKGGYDAGDIFGRPAGGVCVNTYFFDPNEELLSCCSCYVSPNGLHSLSLQKDILGNLLTPGGVNAGTVVLVASDGATGNCNNQAATWTVSEGGVGAWMTTLHQNTTKGPVLQATEFQFQNVAMDLSEQTKLQQLCGTIITNGSNHGLCNSCPSHGLGATKH